MDGDGCFTIGYVKMMNTFYIKAIISQKENQEDIRKVTGGSMEYSQEKKKIFNSNEGFTNERGRKYGMMIGIYRGA